jgi:cytidine deaminase
MELASQAALAGCAAAVANYATVSLLQWLVSSTSTTTWSPHSISLSTAAAASRVFNSSMAVWNTFAKTVACQTNRLWHRLHRLDYSYYGDLAGMASFGLLFGRIIGGGLGGLARTTTTTTTRNSADARTRWTRTTSYHHVPASPPTGGSFGTFASCLPSLLASAVLLLSPFCLFLLPYHDEDDDENASEDGTFPRHSRRDFCQTLVDDENKKRSTGDESSSSERYLELLVHNVSHTDLVLSLDDDDDDDENKDDHQDPSYCLCRPRFSCFDLYTRKVLDALLLQQPATPALIWADRYQRALDSPRLSIHKTPSSLLPAVAVGFHVPPHAVPLEDWHDLRIRGRDVAKTTCHSMAAAAAADSSPLSTGGGGDDVSHSHGNSSHPDNAVVRGIRHVFFPLLATLLPRWEQQIAAKAYAKPVHRVLFLVTGVGTPRNWTHSVTGNSTKNLADLMQVFLQRIDPNLVVVKIHSDTNIFRYDENLVFVERELVPAVEAYRDAHARGLPYPDQSRLLQRTAGDWSLSAPEHHDSQHPFNEDWKKSFSVTMSFADGSPARTHVIQACLRPYRPIYFHFWQLKSWWHEQKIVDDDIEVHSFEAMETIPPIDPDRCSDLWISSIVSEMKSFLKEMTETLATGDHDIHRFWLRKTHKPVLAVLLVQTRDMKVPVLYRGTNMEVSMPTGSLCAERNVIGSALAQNPALKRQDLKLIAVLAVPQIETEVKAKSMSRVMSTSTVASSWDDRKSSVGSEQEVQNRTSWHGSEQDDWADATADKTASDATPSLLDEPGDSTATPVRRIDLFSKTAVATRKQSSKRTVVFHSCKDLNPLKPCGACNEWLKKIAESNPYFRIITFTDANCNGIYVSPCQQ